MNENKNPYKIENRLVDVYGNILWFKIYVLELIEEYELYNKLVIDKLKRLPEYTDLLCAALIIRSIFADYTEHTLEIKIENELTRKYVEYMDKEIYALESYTYDPFDYTKNKVEIYSKINNDYIENKSLEFQKEFEALKTPEVLKMERKLKK